MSTVTVALIGFAPTVMTAHPSVGEQQLSQKYFWGLHGGVGGGDTRPDQIEASKRTLLWTVEEMERRSIPLAIDKSLLPDSVNVEVQQDITKPGGIFALMAFFTPKTVRDIPSLEDIHEDALKRYKTVAEYRPESLKKFGDELKSRLGL